MKKFFKDESGATAIEYGLIAAGICLAISVIVPSLGGTVAATFTSVEAAI